MGGEGAEHQSLIVHSVSFGPCEAMHVQGGMSWHFNFAWEISRFKLTAKFPTRNSGFSITIGPRNNAMTSGVHHRHGAPNLRLQQLHGVTLRC